MSRRSQGYLAQLVVYVAALGAAAASAAMLPIPDPMWRAFVADALATVVVFAFSFGLKNSSMYDPYWSVAPPALFAFWAIEGEITPRAMIAGALTALWGARLTYNFLRGFEDLGHEDWRYRDLRAKHGKRYWLVSFFGIHFMPTVLTFAGSVSLFVVLRHDTNSIGWLDGLALAVTLLGIAYETIADEQLRAFVKSAPTPGSWLQTGLWKHTRHPNYFGEVSFWWGLYLFALAAHPGAWWAIIGPLAITLLFFFISIPMIDRRMEGRRPGYAEYSRGVSRLVPWFIRPQ